MLTAHIQYIGNDTSSLTQCYSSSVKPEDWIFNLILYPLLMFNLCSAVSSRLPFHISPFISGMSSLTVTLYRSTTKQVQTHTFWYLSRCCPDGSQHKAPCGRCYFQMKFFQQEPGWWWSWHYCSHRSLGTVTKLRPDYVIVFFFPSFILWYPKINTHSIYINSSLRLFHKNFIKST